ncbi:MAG: acyl-CoA dehydrogenase family protein [Desulfobacteraceae bacterium]
MDAPGFLEKLYNGIFDEKLFSSCHGPQVSDRAKGILNDYLSVLKNYNPVELEESGRLPQELWDCLKSSGMFALTIPETYGGSGLSLWDYLWIIEGAAARDMGLAIVPLAHHSIGLKGIILFGSEEQKRKYLPPAASGDMIFAYVLTEPNTGSDAQHIDTFAEKSPDGKYYILNGTKTYITNGGYAGGMTVFAQLDKDKPGYMGAFIVETGWEGITVGKDMHKMGLTLSSTTMVKFNNVKVPAENLIGKPGDGFKIAMTILNYGRLGLAAASTGLMNQSADEMIERANRRKQFGVPISNFELIQEKIVKACVYAFLSKAITAFTSGMIEDDSMIRAAIETSHAKLFSTTNTWDVLYDALQVHGGSGYLKTLPYEKRIRDFRVTTVFEGTTEIHSIYPPLFLLRNMTKGKKYPGSSLVKIIKSAFGLFKGPSIKNKPDDPFLKKAMRLALKRVRRVRFMLVAGVLTYGKKVTEREFFLRRITLRSIDAFLLMSAVSYITKAESMRYNVNNWRLYLEYYIYLTAGKGKRESRIRPDNMERAHRKVFSAINRHEKKKINGQ